MGERRPAGVGVPPRRRLRRAGQGGRQDRPRHRPRPVLVEGRARRAVAALPDRRRRRRLARGARGLLRPPALGAGDAHWRGVSVPTVLLVGGAVLGLLVAVGCRYAASVSARRRASRANGRLRTAIEGVTDELVVDPMREEVDAYTRLSRRREGCSTPLSDAPERRGRRVPASPELLEGVHARRAGCPQLVAGGHVSTDGGLLLDAVLAGRRLAGSPREKRSTDDRDRDARRRTRRHRRRPPRGRRGHRPEHVPAGHHAAALGPRPEVLRRRDDDLVHRPVLAPARGARARLDPARRPGRRRRASSRPRSGPRTTSATPGCSSRRRPSGTT